MGKYLYISLGIIVFGVVSLTFLLSKYKDYQEQQRTNAFFTISPASNNK